MKHVHINGKFKPVWFVSVCSHIGKIVIQGNTTYYNDTVWKPVIRCDSLKQAKQELALKRKWDPITTYRIYKYIAVAQLKGY